MIVGIDPGFTGAIAFLDPSITRIENRLEIYNMPVLQVGITKVRRVKKDGVLSEKPVKVNTSKMILDLVELRNILSTVSGGTFRSADHVFIEKSQPMPKQGVAGVGNYMMGYGILIGMLSALRLAYTEVTPQAWKKVMMAGMGREKSEAIVRARQVFPHNEFQKGKDGRAEAALIAEYGRRSRNELYS